MQLSPTIDSLAGQFAGRVKVGKVDITENFEVANRYRVFSVPRVFLFKGGDQPVQQVTGAQPEAVLVKMVNDVLGK